MDLQKWEIEERKRKAFAQRYKKALCVNLNLEDIKDQAWRMRDELEECAYVIDNDAMFVRVMDGDEEEQFEYRCAFDTLSNDLERFITDLEESYIPDCFDDMMVAICKGNDGLMGFDSFEGDYFGLDSYSSEWACKEASKRVERLKKSEIIEAAQQSLNVVVNWLALQSRFGDLKSAVDIIRSANMGVLSDIKRIEQLFDEYAESGTWQSEREWNRIVDNLPTEVWLR